MTATKSSDELDRFLSLYDSVEPIQEADQAYTDRQLNEVFAYVAAQVALHTAGTIIDLGCGNGILLERLSEFDEFINKTDWIYAAVGTEENLDSVIDIARKHKLLRRVEAITLDAFYAEWPSLNKPQLVFCRNVLHELNIAKTAELLEALMAHLEPGEIFVLQDLACLPISERHNVCWHPDQLKIALQAAGFDSFIHTNGYSTRGARWFNIKCERDKQTSAKILDVVYESRHEQFDLMHQSGALRPAKGGQRDKRVELADFDLQFGHLARQLLEIKPDSSPRLTGEQQDRLRILSFTRVLEDALKEDKFVATTLPKVNRLRERGIELDTLESFLRNSDRVALVAGGRGMGKTTLCLHLLATRSYDKLPVYIELTDRTVSVWMLVEDYLAKLGVRLPGELLASVVTLKWNSVEIVIRSFLRRLASRTIVCIDNFHHLINSNNEVEESAIGDFLKLLITAPGAKVILSSTSILVPNFIMHANGAATFPEVALRRYSLDETVGYILDDHFDRAASGIKVYPARLIRAIDRHPLLAELVAKNLQVGGADIIFNESFLHQVELKLRQHLWNRLVTEASRPAIEAVSNLRLAVPRFLLNALANSDSVADGLAQGLLYDISDLRFRELIGGIGAFRLFKLADEPQTLAEQIEPEQSDNKFPHDKVADLYRSAYRIDDDPKWLRESYFHLILAGSDGRPGLGNYYRKEMVSSGHYCYERKDFVQALELYEAAGQFEFIGEEGSMRAASCMIRTGRQLEGEQNYQELTKRFPLNVGIRTSHVDALLALGRSEEALRCLGEYGLTPDVSSWVAGQYGRIYLRTGRYLEAEEMFKRQIQAGDCAAAIFVRLGFALDYQGKTYEALEILEKGLVAHPGTPGIKIILGFLYERAGKFPEATELLSDVLVKTPNAVYAGLGLVRAFLKSGDLLAARTTVWRLEKACDVNHPGLVAARAFVDIAEGLGLQAIRRLEEETTTFVHENAILLDCYVSLAEADSSLRQQVSGIGLNVRILDRYSRNAHIALARAKLAALAGEVAVFEKALDNIAELLPHAPFRDAILTYWNRYNDTKLNHDLMRAKFSN